MSDSTDPEAHPKDVHPKDGPARAVEHARLVGERVLLRPVTVADAAPAYRAVAGREEILRWLVWGGPAGVQELEERFASWRTGADVRSSVLGTSGGHDYWLAIEERETGELVGSITVRFAGHPGDGDIGYWISSDRWGRGYATEAVRLAVRFGFAHLGASVLFAWVFVGNEASRRVLEKCGFALEYTARGKVRKGGKPVDEWYLAQTRWDWERSGGAEGSEADEVRYASAAGPARARRSGPGSSR